MSDEQTPTIFALVATSQPLLSISASAGLVTCKPNMTQNEAARVFTDYLQWYLRQLDSESNYPVV